MKGEAESAGQRLSGPEAVFLVLTFLLLGSTAQAQGLGVGVGSDTRNAERGELVGEEGRAGPLEEQAFWSQKPRLSTPFIALPPVQVKQFDLHRVRN